jgi:hypothetical protein
MPDSLFSALEAELPPLVFLNDPKFRSWTGLTAKTVRNLLCERRGPPVVRMGRRLAIPRDRLLAWMRGRLTAAPTATEPGEMTAPTPAEPETATAEPCETTAPTAPTPTEPGEGPGAWYLVAGRRVWRARGR